MRYEGEFFTFDENNHDGGYYQAVELSGGFFGWASFDDPWRYEHTCVVPVPRDLEPYGIDTSAEDGTSLFKNGELVFDSLLGELVYVGAAEPAFGGRYHGMMGCGDTCDIFEDYFDISPDVGIFVLTME